MLGYFPEFDLKKSWLEGTVMNAALANPVDDARMVLPKDETQVRALRKMLEFAFVKWRNEKGVPPVGEYSLGLLGNPYVGKPLEECPPYVCIGDRLADYVSLLKKLRTEQYPPLMGLESVADNLGSDAQAQPDNIPSTSNASIRLGMQRLFAVLILSEAAAGNINSAAKAHWELSKIQQENDLRYQKQKLENYKVMHEYAIAGIKSREGYKNRDEYKDKPDCQAIAKALWQENSNLTIAALIKFAEIAPYAKKYKGKNTLHIWLSEIDPRPPEKKRGRKKTKN